MCTSRTRTPRAPQACTLHTNIYEQNASPTHPYRTCAVGEPVSLHACTRSHAFAEAGGTESGRHGQMYQRTAVSMRKNKSAHLPFSVPLPPAHPRPPPPPLPLRWHRPVPRLLHAAARDEAYRTTGCRSASCCFASLMILDRLPPSHRHAHTVTRAHTDPGAKGRVQPQVVHGGAQFLTHRRTRTREYHRARTALYARARHKHEHVVPEPFVLKNSGHVITPIIPIRPITPKKFN